MDYRKISSIRVISIKTCKNHQWKPRKSLVLLQNVSLLFCMTVNSRMNFKEVWSSFWASVKTQFSILPTAKLFANQTSGENQVIQCLRMYCGYLIYTVIPLIVVVSMSYSTTSWVTLQLKIILNDFLWVTKFPTISKLIPAHSLNVNLRKVTFCVLN